MRVEHLGPKSLIDTSLEAGKIPPQAIELEQAVLGASMLERRALQEVSGFLKPQHFYAIPHQIIWKGCCALYDAGNPVDILTITHWLKKSGELDFVGGPFYISQLTNKVASSANVEYHARIIVQEFVAREVIRINAQAMRDGYDPTEDAFDLANRTEAAMAEMLQGILVKSSVKLGDIATEQLENMDKEDAVRFSPTGWEKLNKVLGGGYQGGDLAIIAGRPGMGKSAAAFSDCLFGAQQGCPTALYSLELGEVKTNARMVSINTGIPLAKILSGAKGMEPHELQRIQEFHTAYAELPIYTNFNSGISLPELRADIGRMVRRYGIRKAIIDQLNWVNPGKKVEDRVGAITRGCKLIAQEFDISVILLHQLSRGLLQRGGDKRPELHDLRDSGAAEQDAQLVIFTHRPEYYNIREDEEGDTKGKAQLIVAKHSNGSLATVNLYFDAPCAAYRSEKPTDTLPF